MIKNSQRKKGETGGSQVAAEPHRRGLGHPGAPRRCRQAPSRPRQHQQAVRGGRSAPGTHGRRSPSGKSRFDALVDRPLGGCGPRRKPHRSPASGCNASPNGSIIRHFEGAPARVPHRRRDRRQARDRLLHGQEDQAGRDLPDAPDARHRRPRGRRTSKRRWSSPTT